MSRVKDTVKRVLDDFFKINEEYGADVLDDEERDLLSTAISDALGKEVQHENKT